MYNNELKKFNNIMNNIDVKTTIQIIIDDVEFDITREEALELYNQLKQSLNITEVTKYIPYNPIPNLTSPKMPPWISPNDNPNPYMGDYPSPVIY